MRGISLVWSVTARMRWGYKLWQYSLQMPSINNSIVVEVMKLHHGNRKTNKMYKCAKFLSNQLSAISNSLLIFSWTATHQAHAAPRSFICLFPKFAPVTGAAVIVTSEPARKD